MNRLMKVLRSLLNSVPFWKDKDVPGVADQVRKTQLKQDQKARQGDMKELLRMVREGRIHEADERQLENLKLALELNNLLGERKDLQQPVDSTQLVDAIKQAISEGMSNITVNSTNTNGIDSSRPQMKHTSLTNLIQSDAKVDISHKGEISKEVEGQESTDKLDKLRKIKGGN